MSLPAKNISEYSLMIIREFNAPCDTVFQAWTTPEILIRWFGPEGVVTSKADVELRIGGKYQLTMIEPDDRKIQIGGQYREIDPVRKLVFTWELDGQGYSGNGGQYAETLVTVELEPTGSSTRLTLIHQFLPTDRSKREHRMGWIGSFDGLEEVLL